MIDTIHVLYIRDWGRAHRYIPFSFHRTEAGAKANVKRACDAFDTTDYYIDDPDVQE